ncbi:MAG: helix-turn-helix transcriptional regulator [Tannerellaceae bacterium]|nr:helix-turn-helix transcriptional regulator [Tannerellaceae bacterium]
MVRYFCPLDLTMEVIGGKWKAMVIFHLQYGPLRSSDLQRRIRGISNKMFTQAVRDLEKAGIIERTVFPVVPPKVEYKLTDLGYLVLPNIIDLSQLGRSIGKKIK